MSGENVFIHSPADVPHQLCPSCGAYVGAATELGIERENKRGPGPGGIVVCAVCGQILVFTDEMKMRSLTWIEMMERADTGAYKLALLLSERIKAEKPFAHIARKDPRA